MNFQSQKILNPDIFKLILVIFVIELFSLISFKSAILSGIGFIIIAAALLLFTLYKLEYGLYIALIELMIGSYGYLFYLQLPGFKMPIRLAIFLIVFFVWLFKYFNWQKYQNLIKKDRLTQNLVLFGFFILIGVINGILQNNGLKNVFFDVNNYLYLGLFFVFLDVLQTKKQINTFLKVFLASQIYLTIKVFLTLYIFTHGFSWLTDLFYTWIRDTRVGEITWAGNGFFRIFIQSQIYTLIGIFVTAVLITNLLKTQNKFKEIFKDKNLQYIFGILIILQTSILISFSRSFWLGGFCGGLCLLLYIISQTYKQWQKLGQTIFIFALGVVASIALMITIVNFPLPKPSANFSADLLKNRFTAGDEAASSRWNLLPVLINKIKKAPILGTGFGSTVTYQTADPRIKNEKNPDGWYTTYTFEWGYLDTIIEIGILGLLVYLIFIGQIFYRGLTLIIQNKHENKIFFSGFLIGLLALVVTHSFSPYLNHPLGLGYLMLCAALFSQKKDG